MFATVKRDLYSDLIRIEERGKRNKSSLFLRLMGKGTERGVKKDE